MARRLPSITFFGLQSREGLSFGLMMLSAALRRRGITCRLVLARSAEEALKSFAEAPTDVVGFSVTTGLHRVFVAWALALKRRFGVHTVFGGPHPTFFPDFVATPGVDAICIGEGESSLPAYLEAFGDAMAPPSHPVPGWRHKREGSGGLELLEGEAQPLEPDLDALPSPDWSLYYDRNPWLASHPVKSFLGTRGCPYRCTYCFNREWLDRSSRPASSVVRTRDPELVVGEIEDVRRRWPLRLVWFLDSNFAANRKWLASFLPLYRARVGLPFFCKVRPNSATPDLVESLVGAGCTSVGIGIESGNDRLRNEVLERRMSSEQIVNASLGFVERGARVMSFNMVGLPGETYEMAKETLALNVEARVDYAMTMFLQPFPGTEIARRARAEGLFDGDFEALASSYFQPSPIRSPSPWDRRRIVNLQRLMAMAVAFPEVRRHIDLWVSLPENPFYLELFKRYNHRAFHSEFYKAYSLRLPRKGLR
ncbi:MAG: radical SAM protein [Polyangia bacterium]|jgi:radical SAM superfamily enzyme YgiQ (UPF0313 family)|nr:radical SAM protein [Polyangia bacterium]